MVLKSIREAFLEIRTFEKRTLEDENLTASEARLLYNRLVSLNANLTEKQMQFVRSCEGKDELCNTDLFDEFQLEVIKLKSKLMKIIETNPITPTISINSLSSSQSDPAQPDTDSFLRKQKLAIRMIDSLEWQGDLGTTEARVRLNHLSTIYDRYVSSQFHMAQCTSDESAFNMQLKTTAEVQQKVISLETRLKDVIASNVSAALNLNQSKSKKQVYKIVKPGTSVDSGSACEKHKLPIPLLHQPQHPKRSKIGTTSMEKSETGGQSNHEDQLDRSHTSKELGLCFKEQEKILKMIKKLKKIDFSASSKNEIEIYSELIRTIRSSFVENAQKIFMQSNTNSQIITDQMKLQDEVSADLQNMKLNLMRALPKNEALPFIPIIEQIMPKTT